MNRTRKEGSEFEFIGIKDGQEIVRENFLIAHDGCHIRMLSEDNTILL